jgi:cell division protein FtsZ
MSLQEARDAAEIIRTACDSDAEEIFGVIVDPSISDKVKVTVIASGIEAGRLGFARPARAASRRRVEAEEEGDREAAPRERAPRERERGEDDLRRRYNDTAVSAEPETRINT